MKKKYVILTAQAMIQLPGDLLPRGSGNKFIYERAFPDAMASKDECNRLKNVARSFQKFLDANTKLARGTKKDCQALDPVHVLEKGKCLESLKKLNGATKTMTNALVAVMESSRRLGCL